VTKLIFALIPALVVWGIFIIFGAPWLGWIFASCIFGFGLDVLSD